MSELQERIENAVKSGRMALIPFLTAGFPTPERFWEALKELDENGADIIEIGVPFSDPVADGPVVEMASVKALEHGVSLARILSDLKKRKGQFKAELVLMGYYNPFLQYGLENLARDAADAGVAGFIVPDLPLDESGPIKTALTAKKLDLIPLVGPNTSLERMRQYAETATGYAYVVSVMGITGVRQGLPPEVTATIERARQAFGPLPVVLGFGVREPAQLEEVRDKLHGVVFGSALIKHIDNGGTAGQFMQQWL